MPVVRAVLFDYGLTLVSFSYPRRELVEVLEAVRPWLGPSAPDAETLMRTVLEPLEEELAGLGEDEVDYMPFYESAWRRAGLEVPRRRSGGSWTWSSSAGTGPCAWRRTPTRPWTPCVRGASR